jgi:prepilin-type N-terminal cleavage/methylation domain-containing protein
MAHPHSQSHTKRGFTLVELAIVLVIIALIVAGVLVGQSLVGSGRLRAQISQINQFNTALATFALKFESLPGDWRNDSAVTGFQTRAHTLGHGDGDGKLHSSAGGHPSGGAGENLLFWKDLADAQFIPFTSVITDAASEDDFVFADLPNVLPFAAAKRGNYVVVYTHPTDNKHYFQITQVVAITDQEYITNSAGTVPVDAQMIDKKMDDGMPNTGNVRAVGATPEDTIDSDCAADGAVATPYDTSKTGLDCSLRFRITS